MAKYPGICEEREQKIKISFQREEGWREEETGEGRRVGCWFRTLKSSRRRTGTLRDLGSGGRRRGRRANLKLGRLRLRVPLRLCPFQKEERGLSATGTPVRGDIESKGQTGGHGGRTVGVLSETSSVRRLKSKYPHRLPSLPSEVSSY